MSAVLPRRRTGRGLRRAPFFALVLTLLVAIALTHPRDAHGQTDDSVPTWWHEAAGLTPLLTAPPPPNPATICLIDTGVTPTPDLDITARWAYDGGTLDDVRVTEDSPGHGTLVAHFAAGAVNGWGGAGAFPHARISSVRVFPREGGASWQDYIRAITRCIKLDAATKVIVISLGGGTIASGEAEELQHHVEQARDLYGVNVVAAAGNGGGPPDFPGRLGAAFTVAAVHDDALCTFSARGTAVDVAAPGCGLVQGDPDGTLWSLDGTSFAAPVVAGVIAALRSYAPSLTAREAEAAVVASARAPSAMLDATAAFRAVGLDEVVARRRPSAHGVTPAVPAAVEPEHAGQVLRAPPLPRPKLIVRQTKTRVWFRVRNRPPGATLEMRIGRQRIARRASAVRIRTRERYARCRFVLTAATSEWTTVRW